MPARANGMDAGTASQLIPGVRQTSGRGTGGPMEPKVGEITDVLSRTPAVLTALLAGVGPGVLAHRVTPGTFSPMDVLGHLIHGEKTDWVPRIRLILASGDNVPFMAFDRCGFEEAIRGRSGEDLLVELTSLRQANLDFLAGLRLSSEQLSQAGRHPELGRVTLGQLLATWAAHDLNHVDQIARVICSRYSESVGPWRAFLGILNRQAREALPNEGMKLTKQRRPNG